jgi:hypothetical protein
MSSTPENTSLDKGSSVTAGVIARARQILVMFLIMGLELFLGLED